MPRLSAFELPEELGRSLSHVKTGVLRLSLLCVACWLLRS